MQTVTALGLGTGGEDHSNAEAVPCTELCQVEEDRKHRGRAKYTTLLRHLLSGREQFNLRLCSKRMEEQLSCPRGTHHTGCEVAGPGLALHCQKMLGSSRHKLLGD